MIDPDRTKRVHVIGVSFHSSSKRYVVTLKDPSDNSTFEVDWEQWKSFGDWQQRKRENNHF